MAFPTVESITETSFSSFTTSHNVSMPATVNSGDLLIIFIAFDGNPVTTTPTDWTQLYDLDGSNFVHGSAYVKKADGTEGGTTVDVVTDVNEAGAAHVYRITGWDGTLANVEATTDSIASTSSPDPPNHTPSGGAQDYLWIATVSSGDDDQAATAAPTDYTNLTDTVCGGGTNNSGRIASARRELNASSENPGTFTLESVEACAMATVSVPPAAAAVSGVLRQPHQEAMKSLITR